MVGCYQDIKIAMNKKALAILMRARMRPNDPTKLALSPLSVSLSIDNNHHAYSVWLNCLTESFKTVLVSSLIN